MSPTPGARPGASSAAATEEPRPASRPVLLVPVTAIVAGGIVASNLVVEGLVWLGFALVGTALALVQRRAQVWPFWAALGLVAAVSGSYGRPAFSPMAAAAATTLAIGLSAAVLVGAATVASGPTTPLEVAAGLARGLVGLPGAHWSVDDGRLVRRGASAGGATLSVQDGWIVATNRSGFSRLVGAAQGRVRLEAGEVPHRAVQLDPIGCSGLATELMTRDAVRIRQVEWFADFQIRHRSGASALAGEPYPYDPIGARQAAWSPEDIRGALEAATLLALRKGIRRVDMGDLFDPTGEAVPLEAALTLARRDIATAVAPWGLSLLSLEIGHIELVDEIQDHLTAIWHARVERQVRALAREEQREVWDVGGGAVEPGRSRLLGRARDAAPRRRPPQADDAAPAKDDEAAAGAVVAPVPDEDEAQAAAGAALEAHVPDEDEAAGVALTPSEAPDMAALISAVEGATRNWRKSRNPVSFGQFLGTLRRRAEEGDQAAASVLRQVMDVMSRIDAGSAVRRRGGQSRGPAVTPGTDASPPGAAGPVEPAPPSGAPEPVEPGEPSQQSEQSKAEEAEEAQQRLL